MTPSSSHTVYPVLVSCTQTNYMAYFLSRSYLLTENKGYTELIRLYALNSAILPLCLTTVFSNSYHIFPLLYGESGKYSSFLPFQYCHINMFTWWPSVITPVFGLKSGHISVLPWWGGVNWFLVGKHTPEDSWPLVRVSCQLDRLSWVHSQMVQLDHSQVGTRRGKSASLLLLCDDRYACLLSRGVFWAGL